MRQALNKENVLKLRNIPAVNKLIIEHFELLENKTFLFFITFLSWFFSDKYITYTCLKGF